MNNKSIWGGFLFESVHERNGASTTSACRVDSQHIYLLMTFGVEVHHVKGGLACIAPWLPVLGDLRSEPLRPKSYFPQRKGWRRGGGKGRWETGKEGRGGEGVITEEYDEIE